MKRAVANVVRFVAVISVLAATQHLTAGSAAASAAVEPWQGASMEGDSTTPLSFHVYVGSPTEDVTSPYDVCWRWGDCFAPTVSVPTEGVWDYATCPGTALPGVDYTPVAGVIVATPNAWQTIEVRTTFDLLQEGTETVRLWVGPAGQPPCTQAVGSGPVFWATGKIWDRQTPYAGMYDARAVEADGRVEFVMWLNRAPERAVSVRVAFRAADELNGSYDLPGAYVSFPAGVTRRVVSVAIPDDDVHEPESTVTATLHMPVGMEIWDGQAVAPVYDDDAPVAVVGEASVVETDAETTVLATVTLSKPSYRDLTAHVGTYDGTATAGTDYVRAIHWVTFRAGETVKTVPLRVLGDDVAEPIEVFNVYVSPHWQSGNSPVATVTVHDDDGSA